MLNSWPLRRQLRAIAIAVTLVIGLSLTAGGLLWSSYDRQLASVNHDLPALRELSRAKRELADLHTRLVTLVSSAGTFADERAIYLQGRDFTRQFDELTLSFKARAARYSEITPGRTGPDQQWTSILEGLAAFRASSLTAVEMLTVNTALSGRYLVESALGLNQLNQRISLYIEARHTRIEDDLARRTLENTRLAWSVGGGVLLLSVVAFVLMFSLTHRMGEQFDYISSTLDALGQGRAELAVAVPRDDSEFARVLKSLAAFRDALVEVDFRRFAVDQHAIVSSTDLRGNITYVNSRFCEISGYAEDELIGNNHRMLKSGIHPEDMYADLWGTIAEGRVWHGEICNRKKSGGFYWVAATIVPFVGREGRPTHYLSIRTDITSQKVLEQELLRAGEEARQASAAKSAFLATMSHEIRTPMNGIIGMTDLALETRMDAEQREYLQAVKSSADALLVLINDVLDYSRIEAGKLAIEEHGFDLRQALADGVKVVRHRADSNGVELIFDIAEEIPERVIGDAGRVRQVVINLVGNAVKFTDAGRIVVAVERDSNDADLLRFAVSDTGIGIAADKLDEIFESFTQADSSITRKYGGSGLGLAISRRLVGLMGGHIRADSRPGLGSTFHFTLRLRGDPAHSGQSVPEELQGRRVMVVDDRTENRIALARWFTARKMDVIAVESAAEAQTVLLSMPAPDLVVLDIDMPGMDGFALADWIRSHPDLGASPLIFMATASHPAHLRRSRELCALGCLTKPIVGMELMALLEREFCALAASRPGTADGVPEEWHAPVAMGLHVLLVEDRPVNQTLARRLLEKWGNRVSVAANGREALDAIAAGLRFDAVLMDLQMPVMGGLEATRIIRQREQAGNATPLLIIAMTANAMPGDREACLEAGMDDYIAKPIRKEVLAEKLRVIEAGSDLGTHLHEPAGEPVAAGLDAGFDYAAGLRAMDPEIGEILVAAFLDHHEAEMAGLWRAFEEGDAAEAEIRAHDIKGTMLAFGALPAQECATHIETCARNGELASAHGSLEQLTREIGRLIVVLRR